MERDLLHGLERHEKLDATCDGESSFSKARAAGSLNVKLKGLEVGKGEDRKRIFFGFVVVEVVFRVLVV